MNKLELIQALSYMGRNPKTGERVKMEYLKALGVTAEAFTVP